ncbi:hypothetical protein PLANPX_5384 [Lacipirellula parvula]|uniref:Uncharacterized protein n=1 Tax=Lacipirellula parvula TaxID=2650471 RepID=A0A5K7XI91_9BACT|nr:hypothetical protein PLANPX_5384 [Lacipirellula parvula]
MQFVASTPKGLFYRTKWHWHITCVPIVRLAVSRQIIFAASAARETRRATE